MNKKFKKNRILPALAAVAVLSCAAHADKIVGISDMVMNPDDGSFSGANQSFQDWQGSVDGSAWYNGSGLASALNDGDTVPGTLPLHAFGQNFSGTTNYPSFESARLRSGETIDPNTTLTFALSGATDDLNGVILWNHTEGTGQTYRGFKSVTASFSTDGVNFSGSEDLTFAEGPASGTDGEYTVPGQLVSFDSTYDGITHVRFSNITKFIDMATSGDGADLYRMSELRFTAIPEPATLGLVAAFGGAVMFIRRRFMI